MAKRIKLPRRTPRMDIDEMIDWYERYRPAAGRVIRVAVTAEYLENVMHARPQTDGRRYEYRGRTLERVDP